MSTREVPLPNLPEEAVPDAPGRADPAGPRNNGVDLGAEADFERLPAPVAIGTSTFFLVRGPGGYRLLSTVCPHKGGQVEDVGERFQCPKHGWRFDHATGDCLNAPGEGLTAIPVTARDGRLFAEMRSPTIPLGPSVPVARSTAAVDIRLHAHACLELVHDGFSVLTDPWLDGPAFLGAWDQYPPPMVSASDLRPDAICVTHEHSDHFHLPTLERLDRSTPVFAPDFPNRRMVEELEGLGFEDVRPMAFGETYKIGPGITATCFEPASLWNDAIVLFDLGGFRLLNLNDAGLNQRVASLVAPVDAVSSAFSPGASGYPMTWRNVDREESVAILERARDGAVAMLRSAMTLYGGRYLLPFASHFTLWHPSHREFAHDLPRNTVGDVARAFEHSDVTVLDLLPGDSFATATQTFARSGREWPTSHDPAALLDYLERRYDEDAFARHHPTASDLTRAEVTDYLLGLNRTPEMAFCEDLVVRLRAEGGAEDVEVWFEVAGGELRLLSAPAAQANLTMDVPAGVLARVVRENLSWDEAHIGYWCRFSRSPDVYHAGFWRMLQAPYFARGGDGGVEVDHDGIGEHSVVGELIERHGPPADRIMRRYGLYCVGCHRSTADTLAAGAAAHGLDDRQRGRMVRELRSALGGVA